MKHMLLTTIAAMTLTSCGGGQPDVVNDGQSVAETPVAELDCSAAKPASAPAGGPVDDVVGVRSGMSLDEVKLLLKCTNKAFRFEERNDGFRLPDMPDGAKATTQLVARRGEIQGCNPDDPSTLQTCLADAPDFTRIDETVFIQLTGVPGQERVIAVAREITYPEGQEAATVSISKDLAAKYGEAPLLFDTGGTTARVTWTFDGQGRRMSAQNPDLIDCVRAVGTGATAPSQLRPGCRRTINAWVEAKGADGQIAEKFGVVSVDQQAALDAIDAAKAAIMAARTQARDQEVERAKQRSGSTTL